MLVYFRNRHPYQNLACGEHFRFKNYDLFENVDLMIGIKSLNTKQCPARLSSPPVKLGGFKGSKFFPEKGQSNLQLLLIFVFVNPRNFMI